MSSHRSDQDNSCQRNDGPRDSRRMGYRPDAPGLSGMGPGSRQTTRYHQQQQDHAREVRQRKLERQQQGRHEMMQHQQQQFSFASLENNHPPDHHQTAQRLQQPPPPPPDPRGRFHNSSRPNGHQNPPRSPSFQDRPAPRQHRMPRPTPPLANRAGPPAQPAAAHSDGARKNVPNAGPTDVIELLSDSDDGKAPTQCPPPSLANFRFPIDVPRNTCHTQSSSAAVASRPADLSRPAAAKRKSIQVFLEEDENMVLTRSPKKHTPECRKKPPPPGATSNLIYPPAEAQPTASQAVNNLPRRQKSFISSQVNAVDDLTAQAGASPAAGQGDATALAAEASPTAKTVIALSSDESSNQEEEETFPRIAMGARVQKATQEAQPVALPTCKKPSTEVISLVNRAYAKDNMASSLLDTPRSTKKAESKASQAKEYLVDTSEDDRRDGKSPERGTKKQAGTQQNVAITLNDDEDSDSADCEQEENLIQVFSKTAHSFSSDDDEGGGDSSDQFPKTLSRKSTLLKAGGPFKTPTATTAGPTMRGVGKAPERPKPKSRIQLSDSDFSSDSEFEEEDDDSEEASWSDSQSESEEKHSYANSNSWYSLGCHPTKDIGSVVERFGQKMAANPGVAREKQAARKSVNNANAATFSQRATSKDDTTHLRREVVISPCEDAETDKSGEGVDEGAAAPQNCADTGKPRQSCSQRVNKSANEEKKKNRDGSEEEPHSNYTPNLERRKQLLGGDSDEEFCESDGFITEGMLSPKLRHLSPLGQRRCRSTAIQSGVDRRLHIESPHATTGHVDDDADEKLMVTVNHLSKVNIHPITGLPFMEITCHAEHAEILYDFRVDVAASAIPNAGKGAYLTFLGARHLKDEAFSKSPQKLEQKPLVMEDLLEAKGDHGFGIHVKLTGESIDATPELRPKGIGPNYVFAESDYESSPTTVFSSKGKGNGLIHLGRYGPLRTIDRKPVSHFDVKSFILGYEPSEWCFGVDEKLFGRYDQIIDITDDLTGKPHSRAQQSIPMYVNEVGHNKRLKQNVESRTRYDRSIHYYINIVEPMKKGDRVELLTDYFDHYEDIRVRKGYGKANLKEGLMSDDDARARYERNVELRTIITQRIRDLDLYSTYQVLEFVEESIHKPLLELIGRFLEAHQDETLGTVPVCLARQFVAFIRLQYFGNIVLKHIEDLTSKLEGNHRLIALCYPVGGMLKQCKEWAQRLKMVPVATLWKLRENAKDSEGVIIHDALRSEILELRSYDMRRELRSPYDPGLWCPIALRLIDRLSWEVTAKVGSNRKESRVERLYRLSADFADEIRREAGCPPTNNYGLAFDSGVTSDKACVSAKQISSLRESAFDGHSMDPKGLLAGALDMLAYIDCIYLVDDHTLDASFCLPIDRNKQLIMTTFESFKNGSALTSIPKPADNFRKVNVQWYLVWQVVYISHAFAVKYICTGASVAEAYSLQCLCKRVGVEYSLAHLAIHRGIRRKKLEAHTMKTPISNAAKSRNTNKKAEKSATGNQSRRWRCLEISSGPPDEPLEGGWPTGWTRKVFERQSGASKGHRDRYWFTPQHQFKLRTMVDVKKFLACSRTVGNNELLAWKMFKSAGTRR